MRWLGQPSSRIGGEDGVGTPRTFFDRPGGVNRKILALDNLYSLLASHRHDLFIPFSGVRFYIFIKKEVFRPSFLDEGAYFGHGMSLKSRERSAQ